MRKNSYIKKLAAFSLATLFTVQTGGVVLADAPVPISVDAGWVANTMPVSGPRDFIENVMFNMVDRFEARLWGTSNEYAAARFIESQFLAMGIPSNNVQFVELSREERDLSTPVVAKLSFEGAADIFGVPMPHDNNDIWAEPVYDLPIVDLGVYPDISLPQGIEGDIIVALRVPLMQPRNNTQATELPFNMVQFERAFARLEESYDVKIKGVLFAAIGNDNVASLPIGMNSQNHGMTAPRVSNVSQVTRPTVGLNEFFLDLAIERSDRFLQLEHFERLVDRHVMATLPASTNNPDAIIILSAHIDSVLGSPGAADSASSVAVMLETARRLVEVDRGNIEFRFAAVGAHENAGTYVSVENNRNVVTSPQGGGGLAGSEWVVSTLSQEQRAIAINLNMDIAASAGHSLNDPSIAIDAISMDIFTPGSWGDDDVLQLNLPAYLVIGGALDVWSPGHAGINNVRAFDFGGSDHVTFADNGVEAASMIMVCNDENDLEIGYHNSRDNLVENYCHDRLTLVANLMHNATLRAIEMGVTKRAQFTIDGNDLVLVNHEQLFNVFDRVDGIVIVNGQEIQFTLDNFNRRISVPSTQNIEFGEIFASGIGVADHANQERNARLNRFVSTLSGTLLS